MKRILLVAAVLLAAFAGGIFGSLVMRTREEERSEQVIRGHRFELTDDSGRVVSFWGIDNGQNAVLAFGSHRPRTQQGGGAAGNHSPSRLDDPSNQRAAIGVIDDSPFVNLRGPNGETLARLDLSIYGKPALWMADETGPRMHLGVEGSDTPGPQDNDWSLAFYPERARIGMYTEKAGGETYVRGSFAVHEDRLKYPSQQPK